MSARTLCVLRTAGSAVMMTAALVACTTGQPESTAAPSGSSTANPGDAVPPAQLPADSPLDPGRYVVSVADAPVAPLLPVLSVPEGYAAIGNGVGVGADDLARYLWVWDVNSVFAHPCDATPEPVGPSVADLAEALAAQALRTSTDPVTVTVGGYDGLYVELSVPGEVDASACPSGVLGLWPGRAQSWGEILGQVDMVWIVDVDGQRLVFDAAYEPATSPDEVAELEEMVATATFVPAEGS
ncbi:MAG: hypothetical protein JWQ45_2703 [Blastococcus sp.]|jgi:hypothetical protein|nr:hypothetical protein [Blastococcus sp.]